MSDYMLLAGSPCLSAGSTITVENADPHAWLSLYGTLANHDVNYGYNNATGYYTFIQDAGGEGVYFGSGCAQCLSVDFVAPGETKTFTYGGTTIWYPNSTVGGVQGAGPAYPFEAQVWSVAGRHFGNLRPVKPDALPLHSQQFMDGQETSIWGIEWAFHNANKPYSATLIKRPHADPILRLELRAGDQWAGDLQTGQWQNERSMVQQVQLGSIAEGVTYWEAWSFKVSSTCQIGCDDETYMGSYWLVGPGDIHSSCSGCSVPIMSEILPGGFLALDLDKGDNHPRPYWIATTPLAQGVWHDEVLQFNIDPTGKTGGVTMWLDGVQEFSYQGPLGEPGDLPYLQFEPYRADYNYSGTPTGPTVVYEITNLQFGTCNPFHSPSACKNK